MTTYFVQGTWIVFDQQNYTHSDNIYKHFHIKIFIIGVHLILFNFNIILRGGVVAIFRKDVVEKPKYVCFLRPIN